LNNGHIDEYLKVASGSVIGSYMVGNVILISIWNH